jgi:hypothetical protein
MHTNNSVEAVIARDSLVMDILCSEFGFCTVSQAMKHIDSYNCAKKEKLGIISEHFNKLSYEWQMGNAKAYLESLATDLQYYIICHLMEDYINDKTSSEVQNKNYKVVC